MIDVGTAMCVLEALVSDSDPIFLVDDDYRETTVSQLNYDRFIDENEPANELRITYYGGTLSGVGRVKHGNLYSMIIDRMTFFT